MAREIGKTFIGPVQRESAGRVSTHFFQVYAKGMPSPLVLSYPVRIQALQARDTMAASENSYLVPTTKLFEAIAELAGDTAVPPPVAVDAEPAQQEPVDDV